MLRTFFIPAAILLVFAAGAGVILATAPVLTPAARVPIPLSVRVSAVEPQSIQLKVHSQGSVAPATESLLIPEVSGRILSVSPKLVAGGYFEQGDVLARIDDSDYRSALDRANAAAGRSAAELRLAQQEHERQVSLAKRQLTSKSQLEAAIRALSVARASQREAAANLAQARQDLERTRLIAPFSGLVRSESVDAGQYVSPGASIATLYASDSVEVRLPIADRQLGFLNLPPMLRGELPEEMQPSVTLSADYAGQSLSWQGRIVRMEAEIDITSRMVQLVARVPQRADQPPMNVGLFVDAEIEGLAAENIVVLPRSSLRNGNQVMVVDDDNRLVFRTIDPLRLYQDNVLIRGGLEAGERVCVSPIQTPIEGMAVEPLPDTTT